MLVKYLKGRSKYIALPLVVVSIINIYLFAIDIFKNKYSELIYLDFLVLFIIMVFFVIDYINFRNSYTNLYNCIENSGEIDSYLVDGQSFEENLIKDIIENLKIKNNVEVSLNELENDVYTDSKCMSYVLDQIINNAIKYSKEVGKIEFNSKKLENGVVLSIKDFGIGINEEDISRVFDKGFTGKNGRNQLYKSTGMGMYFVKKMIDSLGHEIEVCSENGSYTIFNIYFYDISDYLSLDS